MHMSPEIAGVFGKRESISSSRQTTDMLNSLRKYIDAGERSRLIEAPKPVYKEAAVPPIIWETGNVGQIRSLLVLREAELVLAKAQLTGDDRRDWYAKNKILDLEMKIADLRRWLAEAKGEDG